MLASVVPIATGVVVGDCRGRAVHRMEGSPSRLLPRRIRPRWPGCARRPHGVALRHAPRTPLRSVLCRSDDGAAGHGDDGPLCDGCADGSHHRRADRAVRSTRGASNRRHSHRDRCHHRSAVAGGAIELTHIGAVKLTPGRHDWRCARPPPERRPPACARAEAPALWIIRCKNARRARLQPPGITGDDA